MVRRPVGFAGALCAIVLALAACGGGSSKSAASSDSPSSSSKTSSSSSASSDAGSGTSSDVTDKTSFCNGAKDISDRNTEVGAAVVTILSADQSGGGGSFPSDAEKTVQQLAPRLNDDYNAMAAASSGSLHDDIVTLRDSSATLFEPLVQASSHDEFSSAISALAHTNSDVAKAAAKVTPNIDAVTFSECNVHIAANQ